MVFPTPYTHTQAVRRRWGCWTPPGPPGTRQASAPRFRPTRQVGLEAAVSQSPGGPLRASFLETAEPGPRQDLGITSWGKHALIAHFAGG